MAQTFDLILNFQNEVKREKLRQNVGLQDDIISDSETAKAMDGTSAEKDLK
jgi:hypothetical protein